MHIRHILPQPAMGMLPHDPQHSPRTGLVNIAWNLALRQAAAGHSVEVVGPSDFRHMRQRSIAGVRVSWLPQWQGLNTKRIDGSYLLPLWLFTLCSRGVDIAHVHGNPYFLLRSRTRARVLHYHNTPDNCSPRYELAVAKATSVVCCSPFIAQQVTTRVNYPAQRVHTIIAGLNAQCLALPERSAARAHAALADDCLVLLYVGRITPEKGLLVLINALAQLVRQVSVPLLLLVAGSAGLGFTSRSAAHSELHSYEQQVRSQALGLPVRFLGDVPADDLPVLYRAADIFVCPSIYVEPFGTVNIEAAAAGLPVVASQVGGIPDVVLHERTGLLVPPNDPAALALALHQLIADAPRRARFARAGQDFASQFDWDVVAQRFEVLYARALASTGGVSP